MLILAYTGDKTVLELIYGFHKNIEIPVVLLTVLFELKSMSSRNVNISLYV